MNVGAEQRRMRTRLASNPQLTQIRGTLRAQGSELSQSLQKLQKHIDTLKRLQQQIKQMPKEMEMDDSFFNKIKNGITNIGEKAIDGTVNVANKIKEEAEQGLKVVTKAADDVRDFVTKIPNIITGEFNKFIEKFKGLLEKIKKITGVFAKIKEWWIKFKGWIITACTVLCIGCLIVFLGPLVMPLINLLSTLRSAGSKVAGAAAGR